MRDTWQFGADTCKIHHWYKSKKIPDTESFFQIVSTLYQHRYKRDAERIRTLIFGREPLKPHVRYRADTHNKHADARKTRGYITDTCRYICTGYDTSLYRKQHLSRYLPGRGSRGSPRPLGGWFLGTWPRLARLPSAVGWLVFSVALSKPCFAALHRYGLQTAFILKSRAVTRSHTIILCGLPVSLSSCSFFHFFSHKPIPWDLGTERLGLAKTKIHSRWTSD